jgi:hypothetical protein
MAGCNTAGCIDNQSSIPLAGFYSMSTLKSISVDSLTIGGIGAPNDSLLIDNATVSQVTLPFRAATSTTAFFIHYNHKALSNSRLNDTITFNYDAYPYFASEECGAMYQYHITKVAYTKHLIDSIGIVDSVISNVDLERIHIFMRTATTSSNVRAKL